MVDCSGPLVNRVILQGHLFNVTLVDLQQSTLDPVPELGGDVHINTGHIDSFLIGKSDEPKVGSALQLVADDQVCQDLVAFSLNGDAFSPTLERGHGLIQGVQHAEGLVVGHVVGSKIIFLDTDDTGSRLGQPLLSVGGIVVVRGYGPFVLIEGHLEGAGSRRLFVKFNDLKGGGDIGIRKLRKKGLAPIQEGVGSDMTRCC